MAISGESKINHKLDHDGPDFKQQKSDSKQTEEEVDHCITYWCV